MKYFIISARWYFFLKFYFLRMNDNNRVNLFFLVLQNMLLLFKMSFKENNNYINLNVVKDMLIAIFMPSRSKIGGHIVFVLSVILSFCPPLWNFNLANNFWTVSARALIFYMSIPCDKTFPWIPLFFTLWRWPWSLTHFWKL